MTHTVATPAASDRMDLAVAFPHTIRMLAVDAAQKAGSGHPGAPMGMADAAFVLWDRFLKFDPRAPRWPDRDRFVLSAGHSCLLLYSLLHLYGYDLSLDELKAYRQWGSLTPGHPEYGHTPGVETTTGPLGQGIANAVGMALAEHVLAHRFNRPGYPVVDHWTYGLCSDGDIMEGVAAEAVSLAGHWKLGKLVLVYDDNRITIGGSTELSLSENVGLRFEACGWHVQAVDGHDHEALAQAFEKARATTDRPSLICSRSHIGYGSPNLQDTSDVHGSPLGEDEVRRTKEHIGWPQEPAFYVPDAVHEHARKAGERGRTAHGVWTELQAAYRGEHPDLAREFERVMSGELPDGWDAGLPVFDAAEAAVATRSASGKILNALAARLPEMMGGSADLEPSNKTLLTAERSYSAKEPGGRNVHFGVREHAMGSITNGMAYHGGVRPYNATFLVFSDYQRPSVRLAALAGLKQVFIYTHDSVGVGGDGPTHQPIEHVASLRAIPGLTVIRPADANETRVAWTVATERPGPVALILTRQNVPTIAGLPVGDLKRGGYVAYEPEGADPLGVIIATGSELSLALEAARNLASSDIPVRVVSLPSWELFVEQPKEYRETILPAGLDRRLAVEAGSTLGWWRWVGSRGDVLGVDSFGVSAPGGEVLKRFGFTVEGVERRMRALL